MLSMIRTTRRGLLAGIAGLSVGSKNLARAAEDESNAQSLTLRDLAKARNVIFGAAAVSKVLQDDPAMKTIYSTQTEMIVADYEMKWAEVRPAADVVDYKAADYLADFAKYHDLRLRGHCLAWEENNPTWMNRELTNNNAERILVEHIEGIAGRYSGRIHSWDVVNEPIWPDHDKPNGLRDGIWLETVGPKYIDIAFQTAREADPKAILVLNEAGTETTSNSSVRRRQYLLNLLDRLKDSGVPLDAVGLECHLSTRSPFVEDDFAEYITLLAQRNLKIILTELDVSDNDEPSSDLAVRDQAVGNMYERIISTAVRNPAVIAILAWELSDKYSWLRDSDLTITLRRPDGLPIRPLLYDDDLQAKPCWWAAARALSRRG